LKKKKEAQWIRRKQVQGRRGGAKSTHASSRNCSLHPNVEGKTTRREESVGLPFWLLFFERNEPNFKESWGREKGKNKEKMGPWEKGTRRKKKKNEVIAPWFEGYRRGTRSFISDGEKDLGPTEKEGGTFTQ